MGCAEIRELLSEYIDGVLDEKAKALVDRHLSDCKDCRTELASLKMYIKELGAMKEVEVPKDFLKGIHERLERRFEFKKIMRILFVPIRIKVPLEVTGVTVAAILIISILNVKQPVKDVYLPSVSKPETVLMKPMDVIESGIKMDTPAPAVVLKEAEPPLPAKEEKTIELALVIKHEDHGMALAKKAVMNAETSSDMKALRFEKEVRVAEPPQENKKESPASYSGKILSKVKGLIEVTEGKVISVEYKKDTAIPQYITAEVPVKNYTVFLEKLSLYGTLKKPLPSIPEKDEGPISLRINLMLPE